MAKCLKEGRCSSCRFQMASYEKINLDSGTKGFIRKHLEAHRDYTGREDTCLYTC